MRWGGVNIGFTDQDDDYDKEKKTCFGSYFQFHQKDRNLYKITINYSDMKFFLLKRYYYKNSALEIFTYSNKSYYFNFKYEEDRTSFVSNLLEKFNEPKTIINDIKEGKESLNVLGYSREVKLFKERRKHRNKTKEKKEEKNEKKKNIIKLSRIIKEWNKWRINNFKFLMWMNFLSNRSYNDISQYPIFPWIITNYDEPLKIEPLFLITSLYGINEVNIDMSNQSESEANINSYFRSQTDSICEIDNEKNRKKKDEFNYRDMKVPMGMLEINDVSKKRKSEFIEQYKTLKQDKDEFEGSKPYYYGTNYSNPIYVCNFLMRLFPFTHISIVLQGNRLDNPNRLFLSVSNSFYNSISQKSDVRELIPEFFYLPEMFLNINDVNLGKKEDNSLVYNVTTPCKNNAYSFVEIMKKIFENNYISSYLNYWVDLIFGSKVRGKEAENAKNIYTENSYQENINLNNVENKYETLGFVEFGLIPNQILNKECPKRGKKGDIKKEKELTDYNVINNKLKVVQIKHDTSNDKKMKNAEGKNSKLLKARMINNDRIIMLYDNNMILEDRIGSSSEDINNLYKIKPFENRIYDSYIQKYNNKIIKFLNFGKVLVLGGFYDGRIQIIYFDDKSEKNRKEIYPFSEEEPILCVVVNDDETLIVLGNAIGNIALYKIDLEKDKWDLYKKIFNQMGTISDLSVSNELNLLATSSIDGFVNIYTLPLCKLVRSIKAPIKKDNDGKCNYILLSESTLPSITVITEDEQNCEIFSYSINGQFLISVKEDKNLDCPLKLRDLSSFEYLVYYARNQLFIRNLPSLTLQIVIPNLLNVKSLCINKDKTTVFTLSEDGTQIQAIRD